LIPIYRYRSARDDGGVEALFEKLRRQPNPKNRVELQIEQAVLNVALGHPAHGQVRVSNELIKHTLELIVSAFRASSGNNTLACLLTLHDQ